MNFHLGEASAWLTMPNLFPPCFLLNQVHLGMWILSMGCVTLKRCSEQTHLNVVGVYRVLQKLLVSSKTLKSAAVSAVGLAPKLPKLYPAYSWFYLSVYLNLIPELQFSHSVTSCPCSPLK